MITFGSKPVTLEGTPIKTGDTFPSFKALDADFNEVEPMSKSGKTIVLAVPSIDTPVCSLELGKFLHFMNGKPEVRVISVSQDLPSRSPDGTAIMKTIGSKRSRTSILKTSVPRPARR